MWPCILKRPHRTWRSRGQAEWASAPQTRLAWERASLMAVYLHAVSASVMLPPSARWSRRMRAGRREWLVGLSHPLTDPGTLLRYAMGESVCTVAGPHPELVGRAVPLAMLALVEPGSCLSAVPRAGAALSLHGFAPEVVLAAPTTSLMWFPGFIIQPFGKGPLMAFLGVAALPGLLAALDAFFSVVEAPQGD